MANRSNIVARRQSGRICGTGLGIVGLATALGLARAERAIAFPLIDPTNQDQVPQGTELASPDVQDLQHQLQLVNGLGAPVGGGWTFLPRIDFQEMLTDNVLEQHSPRQADLVTYVSPGFSLVGDLPRISLNLNFAPTLAVYAHTGSADALTEQMNGVGLVTVVPDFAFVDIRAVSGVQSAFGGIGGLGGVGVPAGAAATPLTATPVLAGNNQGLTRDNEVQTASAGISPYLLHSFGDWGTGKLGYSLNTTRSESLSGFATPPFPVGGSNGQTLVSNEEIGHFVSGDILQRFQNTADVDLLQNQTTTDANGATLSGGFPAPAGVSDSRRFIVTDRISAALNRSLTVFVSGGHEDITYSGQTAASVNSITINTGPNGVASPPIYTYNYINNALPSIHDLTWSVGATWTPNPDSQLTVSYGHQNGFNSFAANGYYTLTARTLISLSYGSTLGTQLEYLQNELNLATPSTGGTLVNGQTGGQLFGGTNALAVQDGVFRTDTLTIGSQTTLDRDIISFNLLMAKQTSSGGVTSTSGTSKTFTAAWIHQMRPDMTINGVFSYAIQDQASNFGLNPGNSTSLAATAGWRWQLSDSLSASVRYSLLERHSAVANYDMFQNLLILGISKTF